MLLLVKSHYNQTKIGKTMLIEDFRGRELSGWGGGANILGQVFLEVMPITLFLMKWREGKAFEGDIYWYICLRISYSVTSLAVFEVLSCIFNL